MAKRLLHVEVTCCRNCPCYQYEMTTFYYKHSCSMGAEDFSCWKMADGEFAKDCPLKPIEQSSSNTTNRLIGMKVKIIHGDMCYPAWTDMARNMKLENWTRHDGDTTEFCKKLNSQIGTVIAVKGHPWQRVMVVAVRLENGEEIIIEEPGLKLV